jgi:hypothetical protein
VIFIAYGSEFGEEVKQSDQVGAERFISFHLPGFSPCHIGREKYKKVL